MKENNGISKENRQYVDAVRLINFRLSDFTKTPRTKAERDMLDNFLSLSKTKQALALQRSIEIVYSPSLQ